MSDPHSAIPEHAQPQIWRRYENWRAKRYEHSLNKYADRYPSLRNRRGYRRLVVGLAISLLVTLTAAVVAFFSMQWFLIPYVVGIGGTTAFVTLLRVITGSVADAPVAALDEMQLAQRNSARSIGYIVLFALMFIPLFALIFVGSFHGSVSGQTVYGFGILFVGLVLVGACVPTILTTWWMTDPDPDDFADDEPADAVTDTTEQGHLTDMQRPSVPATPTNTSNLDPPAPAPW